MSDGLLVSPHENERRDDKYKMQKYWLVESKSEGDDYKLDLVIYAQQTVPTEQRLGAHIAASSDTWASLAT